MNILFQRKHFYETHTSIEDIRSRIKELRKTSWHDVAVNLTGKLEEDNSFQLSRKIGFIGFTKGLPKNFVLIDGQLTENKTATDIAITVRCNHLLLLYFYAAFLFLMYDLYTLIENNFATDPVRPIALSVILLYFTFFIRNQLNRITSSFESYLRVGKR
jgi:hypothetical protein